MQNDLMLVPLSWLREFAPFEGDPVALGEVFDNLGMVVEGMRRIGEGLGDVVVAKVLDIAAIPKADKIRRVVVDAGGGDPIQVVCGAWNFEEGATVAFAPVGAKLPGLDFVLERRKMKGVESNGMICSALELGLGEDHTGILVLPDTLEAGRPFIDAMGIESDVVYDLAIETNRPDAMSIAGVARDAAARLRRPFAIPEPPPITAGPDGVVVPIVDAPDLCPRFTVTVFTGANVGRSPEWLARRLTLAGMRPINNLVDVSNYVMLELGQPTHPYDLDKLPGKGLSVRAAYPGEVLVTLDDVERRLGDGPTPDCMIADAEGNAVGIAGIMGGSSSEIDDGTTTVLLEAAYFDRMAIARTSKRLGLRSEASARFERGCDPNGIERAVARYAELAYLTASGQVIVGDPLPPGRVRVRTARVNGLLGTELTDEEIRGHLAPIGFVAEAVDGEAGVHDVTIPTWRPDAEREVDVVEEVARHHGYANIRRTNLAIPFVGLLTPYQRERRRIRDILIGAGVSEAIGPMLLGPGDHTAAGLPEGPGDVIEADSPLIREESILRTSLLPGLLRAVAHNARHRNPTTWWFEIGHVYRRPLAGEVLPDEEERLAVALSGERGAPDAVAVWRVLTESLRLERPALVAGTGPGLHATRTALVHTPGGDVIGAVGEVSPEALAAHEIDGRVGWIDVSLPALLGLPRRSDMQRPVSRQPSADIDLAFAVPEEVPAAAVEDALLAAGGDVLEWVRLFDVYRGEAVAAGIRSLAFKLRFSATDHTLTERELADLRQRCIDAVESSLPARLRG